MAGPKKIFNLVLSGGGVKGIAYIGAFKAAERRGIRWGNIAGVSAGALAGSFAGAGYSADELIKIMDAFDMEKVVIEEIPNRVKAVQRYMQFAEEQRGNQKVSFEKFLGKSGSDDLIRRINPEFSYYRDGLLKNVVTFSKEGCLYDGDYLEEWVAGVLAARGIRTFADLKGGIADRVNPMGYKVRMTAVDASRAKVIVLPDDMAFYGMEPDRLEVSKAVRMSTSVPFAFKPVEIKKTEENTTKAYSIVDGGVFDNFPFWLVNQPSRTPMVGFRLDDGRKSALISLDTPLKILKGLVSAVHDLGIPKNVYNTGFVGNIKTSKVSFLDFNLTDQEKEYLYTSGKNAANVLFSNMWQRRSTQMFPLPAFFLRLFKLSRSG